MGKVSRDRLNRAVFPEPYVVSCVGGLGGGSQEPLGLEVGPLWVVLLLAQTWGQDY